MKILKEIKIHLIAIYVIFVVITLSVNISFAKYTDNIKGLDSGKVSRYSISLKKSNFLNNSTTLDTLGLGGGYSYYFYVTNQDEYSRMSQVAINYKLSIQETSIAGTTLNYKLYKSDINKVRGNEVIFGSTITIPLNTAPTVQYYELVVSGVYASKGLSNMQTKIILDAENRN